MTTQALLTSIVSSKSTPTNNGTHTKNTKILTNNNNMPTTSNSNNKFVVSLSGSKKKFSSFWSKIHFIKAHREKRNLKQKALQQQQQQKASQIQKSPELIESKKLLYPKEDDVFLSTYVCVASDDDEEFADALDLSNLDDTNYDQTNKQTISNNKNHNHSNIDDNNYETVYEEEEEEEKEVNKTTTKRSKTTKHHRDSNTSQYDDDVEEQGHCNQSLDKMSVSEIPHFFNTPNCDKALIEETRQLLRERYQKCPELFYDHDLERMLTDDWTVTRFLLRRRLDPKRTAKLMEECGSFRKQYLMSGVELYEFPIEFHQAGGLFRYAPDRAGNQVMYMRVKMYRRVAELSDVFKAFILCVVEACDQANGGRGTAVVFDLSGCGIQNVDLSFLSWLLSSFRNYCPKGLSYILVYNLPWFLNTTCKLAMSWMSSSNRRALRFAHGEEILNFIARDALPDYLGGTCKLDYRQIPKGARYAEDVCGRLDMSRDQAAKLRELFKEYLPPKPDNIKYSEQPTPKNKIHSKKQQVNDAAASDATSCNFQQQK